MNINNWVVVDNPKSRYHQQTGQIVDKQKASHGMRLYEVFMSRRLFGMKNRAWFGETELLPVASVSAVEGDAGRAQEAA